MKKILDLLRKADVLWVWFAFFGAVLAAFITLVVPSFAEWCIVPLAFLAFFVLFVRKWRGLECHWEPYVFFLSGCLVVQVFAWIS